MNEQDETDLEIARLLRAGADAQKTGCFLDADMAFCAVLTRSPGHAQATFHLAKLAVQLGNYRQADELFRAAWASEPTRAEFVAEWMRFALHAYDSEYVLAVMRDAIERMSQVATLHEQLGDFLNLLGRGDDVLASYRRAVAIDPEGAAAHANICLLTFKQGDGQEGLAAGRRATELDPKSHLTHFSLGRALLWQGRADESLVSFRLAAERSPRSPQIVQGIVEALLRKGDPVMAVLVAEEAMARFGYFSSIAAMLYFALLASRRDEEARTLLGFERFFRQMALPTPPGFADIDSLNRELKAELTSHPTLMWEPLGRTTRGGRQSTNLLEHRGPAVAALAKILKQQVDQYIAALPTDASHPFVIAKPASFGLDIWVTILDEGGHQNAHIHPSGWLSGVYYVQVPAGAASQPDDRAGWIEFGRSPRDLIMPNEPAVWTIQPRGGLLVLFPSHVYHRTIPFNEGTQRISVAFDVIR